MPKDAFGLNFRVAGKTYPYLKELRLGEALASIGKTMQDWRNFMLKQVEPLVHKDVMKSFKDMSGPSGKWPALLSTKGLKKVRWSSAERKNWEYDNHKQVGPLRRMVKHKASVIGKKTGALYDALTKHRVGRIRRVTKLGYFFGVNHNILPYARRFMLGDPKHNQAARPITFLSQKSKETIKAKVGLFLTETITKAFGAKHIFEVRGRRF